MNKTLLILLGLGGAAAAGYFLFLKPRTEIYEETTVIKRSLTPEEKAMAMAKEKGAEMAAKAKESKLAVRLKKRFA